MTHLSVNIPEIETGRLILRATRESDLDAVAAMMAGPRSRFIGGPMDRAQSWRAIAAGLGHWLLRGFGFWTIEHRASGQAAGACGFIHREGWEEPELGWHVYDGFEGQGIAYEAAMAARSHGARHFGLDGVISYIAAANSRSQALAHRLGAWRERNGQLLGQPVEVWRHPRQERAA